MQIIPGARYLWEVPEVDQGRVTQFAAHFNLCLPISQTLVSRGFADLEQVQSYLFSAAELVHHPRLLKDSIKAVERILTAIKKQEKMLVFGDYDVDGITSSAMMMSCLVPLGAKVHFYLPHRVHDGYGLSKKVVERAAQNKFSLIITVDNGISAFEAAERAQQLGLDLIITDHHKPHAQVPPAYAIINPHQADCTYPYKMLAGVGVTFKLLCLLYELLGKELPAKVYELLLLGTVADVVPLTGENRYWVRQGLLHINEYESASLAVLKRNSNVNKPVLSSTDIGYWITPQINALGRLDDPQSGVKFLIGMDETIIGQVGEQLATLNQARKDIERTIIQEIENKIAAGLITVARENILIDASANWPAGVIGLVASRMVASYGKPTILLHITEQGIAKGSCRSIPALNMFEALSQMRDLLISFGGHAMAAGLSLPVDHIPLLKERLEAFIAARLTAADFQKKITIDAQLSLREVNKKLCDDMEYLEPFGSENRQPLFHISHVVLVQRPQLLKNAHVKCTIFADGIVKPLIFFNSPELYEYLLAHGDQPFDVAAYVTQNFWQDRMNIELTGVDIVKTGEVK